MKQTVKIIFAASTLMCLVGCDSSNYKKASQALESGDYETAVSLFEELGDYEDSATKLEEAKNLYMHQKYEDIYTYLTNNTLYYNGGDDLTLNSISFTDDEVTISQVYFDGNGKHDGDTSTQSYTINDEVIQFVLDDGSTSDIPYTKNDDGSITLGNNTYLTTSQIDSALQGYWKYSNSSYLLGMYLSEDYEVQIDNGNIQYHNRALSQYAEGGYFLYGPYSGTYSLNFGGFESSLDHGKEFFFNIIDGEVKLIRYNHIMERCDEFSW